MSSYCGKSLVTPTYLMSAGFELSAQSGTSPQCGGAVSTGCWQIPEDKPADIKYLGVTSDFPQYEDTADSMAYVAISTHTPWATPSNNAEFDVRIDVEVTTKPTW